MDAMRLPALCRAAGVPAGLLLQLLARRWAGPAVEPDEVAEALRPFVDDPVSTSAPLTAHGLQALAAEVVSTLVAQHRIATDVVRVRDVPFGDGARALIVGGTDDLMWPAGQVRRTGASGALLQWWREATCEPTARLERLSAGTDDPGRTLLLASLAAVQHAHTGDSGVDLPLDLIALTVVREWARWLRGFSGASAPYLLTAFLRRPGRLIGPGAGVLGVHLDHLPHDVILDISGCLAAFEPVWQWTPQPGGSAARAPGLAAGGLRRIEFTVGA
jgi:hypothetical protein